MSEEQKPRPVGSDAVDFMVYDQNKEPFTLSKCKGKKVLLSFHPLAWTPVCAQQMQILEKHSTIFEQHNVVAVGISIDSSPSKKAWAQSLGITKTRLLCDFWPHGQVAKSYGILREKDGFSERASIIIDEHQQVCFVKIYPISQLPDMEEILRYIKETKT